MAYEILTIPESDVLDFPHYFNEVETAKMLTEPPTVDASGNITAWTPATFPSTSGLAYSQFDKFKDQDGYLGWHIRLRSRVNLGKIYMYDSSGNPTVRIKIMDNDFANWVTVYENTFSQYNVPVVVDLTGLGHVATDILLEVRSVSYVPKFHIWGERIAGSDMPDPVPSSVLVQPKFGHFMRYCTMTVTPEDYIPKGTERIYLDTRWIAEVKNPLIYPNKYLTKDNIRLRFDGNITAVSNIDNLMGWRKSRNGGVPVQLNIKELPYYTEYGNQRSTPGTTDGYETTAHWVDTLTSNTRDPMSYQMAAAFFYSVTARWGGNAVLADTYLRLMPEMAHINVRHTPDPLQPNIFTDIFYIVDKTDWINTIEPSIDWTNRTITFEAYTNAESVKKGLGYVDTIEIWNELDMWWDPEICYHDPIEMAAFFSAVIDGHNGAMGDGFGIKTADPNMRISLGGSIDFKKYLNWRVFHEMAAMRGQTYQEIVDLIDQIDFHHYCNDGGGQAGTRTTGISPEADDFYNKMVELRDIRDRYHPKSTLNLGEFGWDYSQSTDQKAPPIIDGDIDLTQSAWLIRAMAWAYHAGWDACTWYMVLNASSSERTAWTRYGSCGLATSTYTERYLNWFAANTECSHLYECDHSELIDLGDPEIACMKFTKQSDSSFERYLVFCITSNNTKKQNVSIPIGASMVKANVIDVTMDVYNGNGHLVNINSNEVLISEVSEFPTIILTSATAIHAPQSPYNPVILNKQINDVQISWSLDDFDVEDIDVYRREDQGNENLIATLSASERSYTDNNTGQAYMLYYRIVAKNSSGQSDVSFGVDLPVTYTVNRTVNIDANNSSTLLTPPGFNRIDSKSLFSDLLDDQNVNSGLSFQFIGAGWGWFNYQGVNTGSDIGAVPDNVLRTYMAGTVDNNDPCIARIGLDPTKKYILKVLPSRAFLSTSKQTIGVYGAGELIESAGNSDEFITFYNVSGLSSIDIDFSGYAGSSEYLNALIIEEVTITGFVNPTYPAADAGLDKTVQLPLSTVYLDGSGSYDPSGTIVFYNWQQLSGPNSANIVSPNSAQTTVNGLVQGIYVFRLTVTDNDGATDTDEVQVTVNASPSQTGKNYIGYELKTALTI